MKEIALKKYRTAFTKELLQAATKTPVRECDETAPGQYVAYVDDGDDTWDVAVTVNRETGVVTAHTCECNDKAAICRHRVALIAHIADGVTTTVVKKAAKAPRRDALTILVQDTPADALREWVLTVLRRNKELHLAFTHQFGAAITSYTPADATRMVTDVVKSVMAKKKKADAAQLKKIVELWTDILKPVIAFHHNAVMDESTFLAFDAMIDACQKVMLATDSNSTRVQKYLEEVLTSTAAAIDLLQDDVFWQKTTGYYVQRLVTNQTALNNAYVYMLTALIDITSVGRRETLATMLMANADRNIKSVTAPARYQHFLLKALKSADVLRLYYRQLKPVTDEIAYNTELIQALIDIDEPEAAEECCNKVIASNYYAEFNVPYWLLQRDIYTRMGARSKLMGLLRDLVPHTWSFDDFLTVYNHLEGEAQKNWRKRIMALIAKAESNYNRAAIRFQFDMLQHEKNYAKMFHVIDGRTPFDVLVNNFEALARLHKKEFLPRLLSKSSDYSWSNTEKHEQEDNAQFPILYDLIRTHYTDKEVKEAIKTLDTVRRWRTRFCAYVADRLAEEV
jgi:hypothetical protein